MSKSAKKNADMSVKCKSHFFYLLQSLGQLGYFDWTIEWDVDCISNLSTIIFLPLLL